MRRHLLKPLFFLAFAVPGAYGEDIPDVSLRFYAQWDVGDRGRQRLTEKYGVHRVLFDARGHATPQNFPPQQLRRWRRLYELCMSDGCYYCDDDEGSCETGTCGPKNAHCRPYMDGTGTPQCGVQCADYALTSTLP